MLYYPQKNAAGALVEETLLDGKNVESIHKAYMQGLLRHSEKIRRAFINTDCETAERLLAELIEDTKADISGDVIVLYKQNDLPLS